jgi:hypothetical protein
MDGKSRNPRPVRTFSDKGDLEKSSQPDGPGEKMERGTIHIPQAIETRVLSQPFKGLEHMRVVTGKNIETLFHQRFRQTPLFGPGKMLELKSPMRDPYQAIDPKIFFDILPIPTQNIPSPQNRGTIIKRSPVLPMRPGCNSQAKSVYL